MIKYLTSTYRDGGRGHNREYDCWGLARAIRHEVYGRTLLPERPGPHRLNTLEYQRNYRSQIKELKVVENPTPGCLIAVLNSRVCEHVALVVDDIQGTGLGLHAIETNPVGGVLLQPLRDFLKKNGNRKVIFYDD